MIPVNRFSSSTTMKDVVRERANDVAAIEQIQQNKLDGRRRTATRAAPTADDDVQDGDALGDVITDSTYEYELVDAGGTLAWDRRQLNVSWP